MSRILILGGGFGGIRAGLLLRKNKKKLNAEICLVNNTDYHLFAPSLYEVATSEEPQKNIAIPLKEIFPDSVELVTDTATVIDVQNKKVVLASGRQMAFDYLIMALGSEPEFFGIPGLKEHGNPLKNLEDASRIQALIARKFHEKCTKNLPINVVIGGGGFSGVELAAEITEYRDRLAALYGLPGGCMTVTVVEAKTLLEGLSKEVSMIAEERLKQSGVQIRIQSPIKNVTGKRVETLQGDSYAYDVLIWTGGVRANSLPARSGLLVNRKGQVLVNDFLQSSGTSNIFAIGDMAQVLDRFGRPAPGVAQVAEEQGRAAAENIFRLKNGTPLKPYRLHHSGWIIPLRGHFAIAELKHIRLSGWVGWLLQQGVFLRYLIGILPLWKAFGRWNVFERQLHQRGPFHDEFIYQD